MPDQLLVEILDDETGGVVFRPDGGNDGEPLRARPSDLVVWSNRTDRDLTLESIDPPGLPLNQTIPAGETSQNEFLVPAGEPTIDYRCTDPVQDHVIEVELDT